MSKLVKIGFSVKDACYISPETLIIHTKNHEGSKRKIRKIYNYPFWGYRRITAWLNYRENINVNRKRVYRLIKRYNLVIKRKQYKAKRTPKSKPKPCTHNNICGINMTKFIINGLGWVYLVVVLDWYTKKIVGFSISLSSKTNDWLDALDKAIRNEFPNGIRKKAC